MLELSGVAALGVAEWGVRVHYAQVTQVLKGHQVFALAQAVQPAPAERQRAEVLIDNIQEVLRPGQPGEEKSKSTIGLDLSRTWQQLRHKMEVIHQQGIKKNK